MSDPRFTESGFWIIGSETANPIPQAQFPPDIVQLVDMLTARKYWPYLPYIDLDYMELHHPGSKSLINDLKRALHEEWDMVDGWTGLVNSGDADSIIRRVLDSVHDPKLASFCEGITQDLLLWAMNDERVSMEG